jgi:assimilatory nitrate reductase catalytic subunit
MHARALITDKQKKGNVFIPMHWNSIFSKSGSVGALVNAITDPFSGQPQFKHTPVHIQPLTTAWHGFILCKEELEDLPFAYWVRQKKHHVNRYDIAGDTLITSWPKMVKNIFSAKGDWVEYHDHSNSYYRAALIKDNQLESCIFIAADNSLPDDQWIDSVFGENPIPPRTRINLLSGQPPSNMKPAGKTICACFNVGLNTIIETIKTKKITTTDEIGKALQAGTNCGSCLPELKDIIKKSFTSQDNLA